MHRLIKAGICLATLLPLPCLAHVAEQDSPPSSEIWLWMCLALSLGLYLTGWARIVRKARDERRPLTNIALCFTLGWIVLAVALVPPLDTWSEHWFSAHMMQHQLMMVVAAPLLVLGKPLGVWLWGLPSEMRPRLTQALRRPAILSVWRWLGRPLPAWMLHAVAIWGWHIPAFFDAALENNAIHIAQHLSFLVTALFFWWAVFDRASRGHAVISLFTTMMHTGALGALLTFSSAALYPAYVARALSHGLTPLEDQQLGGLIMWIPAGTAYLGAALGLLFGRLLKTSS